MADVLRSPDCTVNRADCDGPGTYRCDEMVWGSPCRAWQARNGGYSAPDGIETADPFPSEALARRFHETRERLAVRHGTRAADAPPVPWDRVPVRHRQLLIATCDEVLALVVIGTTSPREPDRG